MFSLPVFFIALLRRFWSIPGGMETQLATPTTSTQSLLAFVKGSFRGSVGSEGNAVTDTLNTSSQLAGS